MPRRPDNTERDAEIVRRWNAGELPSEIAPDYHLQPWRVRQIAKAAGCAAHYPFGTPESAARAREAYERKIARGAAAAAALHPVRSDVPSLIAAGFSYGEVARALGISRNSVAGIVWRARCGAAT